MNTFCDISAQFNFLLNFNLLHTDIIYRHLAEDAGMLFCYSPELFKDNNYIKIIIKYIYDSLNNTSIVL